MFCVVTAGGRIDGDYARAAGTTVKALARVRGRTMLDVAIDAARVAGCERVAVVGGAEVSAACAGRVDRIVDESDDGAENVLRALRAWPQDAALLYLSSDVPFASGEALRDFVARSARDEITMPVCAYDAYRARFPNAPAAGITLAGEHVVNGNAFLLPPRSADAVASAAARFFRARKSPWAMARLLGPTMLLRFALRRLSVTSLEAYARRATGIAARALRDGAPELCFDADTMAEYEYARASL